MQNVQPQRCGDQLASSAVTLRLLHFLTNVTKLVISKSCGPAKAVKPYNY